MPLCVTGYTFRFKLEPEMVLGGHGGRKQSRMLISISLATRTREVLTARVSIQKSETITVLNKMDPSSKALQESNGKNGKHLLKLQVTLPSVCLVSSKTQFHVIL